MPQKPSFVGVPPLLDAPEYDLGEDEIKLEVPGTVRRMGTRADPSLRGPSSKLLAQAQVSDAFIKTVKSPPMEPTSIKLFVRFAKMALEYLFVMRWSSMTS